MRNFLVALVVSVSSGAALADEAPELRYLELDGRLQIDFAKGGATQKTPFALASVGKAMTSVAVLRLVEDGLLSLDDPAHRYLSGDIVRGFDGLQGITVRHLLTMTSGLPDYFDDAYFEAAVDDPGTVQQPDVAVSFAYDLDAEFTPGDAFSYSNTNYVLLGLILEEVTQLSYGDVLKAEVFEPAGMTYAFVFGTQTLPDDFPLLQAGFPHYRAYYEGQGFGDGGIIASAQDLSRFYRATFYDRTLLSEPMLREMLSDPTGEGYGMGIGFEEGWVGHAGSDFHTLTNVVMDTESGDLAIHLSADMDADIAWAETVWADFD